MMTAINDNEAKFQEFHDSNPHVYALIEKFAFQVTRAGYGHYGMQALLERVRWHLSIETDDNTGFKINNNHGPYYARLFHKLNPRFEGFFRTRQIKGDYA